MLSRTRLSLLGLLLAAGAWFGASAQTLAPSDTGLFTEFTWRPIAPALAGTMAFDHLAVDMAFPYRVCATSRTAPPVCIASQPDTGVTADREITTVGLQPGGFAAPDPTDADIIYSGLVNRLDRRTGQMQDVRPARDPGSRAGDDAPLIFTGIPNRALLLGTNRVWKTTSAGQNWTAISPDLSRGPSALSTTTGAPPAVPPGPVPPLGTISSLAPSPLDPRIIWAGTSDGLIHVTRDEGQTWSDVTPPGLVARSRIASLEPSHFDPNTAYAAIDTRASHDLSPRVLRTRDGGTTWEPITRGLGDGAPVNVAREDPFRRGLLFAGTDASVSLSFDDGDSWQPLRLNLPDTPVTDMAMKDADVVIATAGRGIWILDDITPLRQITPDVARADAFLFRPSTGWRMRASPRVASQDAAAAALAQPNDGVAISYLLGAPAAAPVSIAIIESISGEVIKRFSSTDDTGALPTTAGLHRIMWDLRYPRVSQAGQPFRRGVAVQPGTYQVRLTVGARTLRQAVTVRLDPRVKTPLTELRALFTLSKRVQDALTTLSTSPTRTAAGNAALSDLMDVFDRLQQSDTKPTPALEADVNAALAQAAQ